LFSSLIVEIFEPTPKPIFKGFSLQSLTIYSSS
jgi:hypothetical protein